MKKFTLLLMALLICSSLFFGCDLLNSEDDYKETEKEQSKEDKDKNDNDEDDVKVSNETKLKEFTNLLIASEYIKAIEYYNENIVGNYDLEYNAQESIINLCKDIDNKVLSGEYDKKQVDTKLGVIDKIVEGIEVIPDGYKNLVKKIDVSLASKSAFLAAKELEELKNYADAIDEYKNVIESDSNYNEAQIAIERCITTLKQSVFDKVNDLSEKSEYIEAITQLKALNENFSGDEEIIAKITVLEKTYINHAIDTAAEAFVTPDTDYSKALDIINGALQHYSDNEELKAKKVYYQSFAPVYLYDMDRLRGEAYRRDAEKDIYGNNHTKVFYRYADITYNINKSYNSFSALVYGRNKDNNGLKASVSIYADGKIVYEKLNMLDNNVPPFTINLNITGVSELRIVMNGQSGSGIGMTDMIVQKNVK